MKSDPERRYTVTEGIMGSDWKTKKNIRLSAICLMAVLVISCDAAGLGEQAIQLGKMSECGISESEGCMNRDQTLLGTPGSELINAGIINGNKTSAPAADDAENFIASLAGTADMLAALMFSFICINFLIFLNDRNKRFCHINFIHLSDGSKPDDNSTLF